MRSLAWILTIALILVVPGSVRAEELVKDSQPAAKPVEPKSVVTSHQVRVDGETIRYTATAGWLIMKDESGAASARFGYTAYTKEGVTDPTQRPVLFGFNGGPGSSSIWLHMGILGPRRIEVNDPSFAPPPPVAIVDNAFTVLDVTDVVMVDPIGTGYSKVLGEGKVEDHWGVDQDIRSVADFIVQWVTENERWRSPKYVLGESYGGIRAPGLAYHLQTARGMSLNGVVLVSPFMHFALGADGMGLDLPHALYFPGLAATAWYHDRIENKPESLGEFLDEVEQFSMNEYLPALLAGYTLPEAEKTKVASKLAGYTGTSTDYWLRAGLRVSHGQFLQELGRDDRTIAGRIDSRFVGPSLNPLAESQDYDPFFPSIGPPFTAGFMDYYRRELEFEVDDDYVVMAEAWTKWDWKHAQPGSSGVFASPIPNVLPDLAHAMKMNPGLGVLVQQGYYDLATPYYIAGYYMKHLDIPADARERIRVERYEAGHMMYVHPPSMKKYREDLARFIRETDRVAP
jgi:carboxypeptidase C (cathepsin A)